MPTRTFSLACWRGGTSRGSALAVYGVVRLAAEAEVTSRREAVCWRPVELVGTGSACRATSAPDTGPPQVEVTERSVTLRAPRARRRTDWN
jgi:hypothetical protein